MDKKIHLLSLKNIKFILKTVLVIAFIGFVIYEGKEELASIKIKDVKMILSSLSVYIFVLFIGGGILAACTSIIHDFIISKELSIKLSNIKIFKIGFIANTINNALGGFSSAGMRVILYIKEGIKPKEATYYNILIVASFSTGLFALTSIIPFNLMSIRPMFTQYKLILIIIIIIIMIINMSLFFTINKFTWLKKKMFGENADKFIPFYLLKNFFCHQYLSGLLFHYISV